MAEIKEFVVNDRRKFTSEGELRPDAPKSEPATPKPEPLSAPEANTPKGPQAVPPPGSADSNESDGQTAADMPLAPTEEQLRQAKAAYDSTVDRLDTAIRAQNLGSEPLPQMDISRFIQSLYMQAVIQLGGAAEPGTQPQVDILGARQTIDMLDLLAAKTTNNLTEDESKLLQSALFEARMGFLEVTQLLARQAAAKQTAPGGAPPAGPSIVK